MNSTLFGIPLLFWGIGCLVIAGVYYWFWPQPNPKPIRLRSRWQHIVLRYFHSLVWFLLAAGCITAGAGYGNIGIWLALSAVPAYVVFMVVLFQDRKQEMDAQAAAKRIGADEKRVSSAKQVKPS